MVVGGTIGTVNLSCMCRWPRNHVCDTGCVPGIGVGSLDVKAVLWYQWVDLCHRSTWWWWRNSGTVEFELHVCQVAPEPSAVTLDVPGQVWSGSLDVKALSYGTRGVDLRPNPPQHMVVVANNGPVEFELHVPLAPNHLCDTGCVPGIGVGSLDVKPCLWCRGVDLVIPPQHIVVVGNSGTVEFELHVPSGPEPPLQHWLRPWDRCG
jgi:hypothetical protein